MKVNGSKVVVMGLDGASFKVIDPLLRDGKLPNLARLIKEGTRSLLQSTVHPLSAPAWASFATGKNPGKHKIVDWRERNVDTYHSDIVSSHSFGPHKTIWEIVNRWDKSVGVFNVPLTFPPKPVNGFLVSGILTPRQSARFTYPDPLAQELQGKFDYHPTMEVTYEEGKENIFFDNLKCRLAVKEKVILHLLKNYNPDLLIFVMMETDQVQHVFWKYMDKAHPEHISGKYAPYSDAIYEIYRQIDGVIGNILEVISDDTSVIVMSDHGGGPLHKVVYIDKLFCNLGLIRFKRTPITILKKVLLKSRIHVFAYSVLAKFGLNPRTWVPRGKRTKFQNVFLSSKDIDWKQTKAYTSGGFGQISINLKGREPQGCVDPADYEKLRDFITAKLYEIEDEETGVKVVDKVYKKEEIYHGDNLENLPDLLFRMKNYTYITSRALGLFEKRLMGRSQFGPTGNSGAHSSEGIFIAKGGGIKGNFETNNARITDLAPTILYMLGIPIPQDMDGKVLVDIFQEDFLRRHPITYQTPEREGRGENLNVYSPDEQKKVKEMLQSLGYLG